MSVCHFHIVFFFHSWLYDANSCSSEGTVRLFSTYTISQGVEIEIDILCHLNLKLQSFTAHTYSKIQTNVLCNKDK